MKNNLINIKIEFEDQPIMESKQYIKNAKEFDNMVSSFRTKIFGGKK